MNGFILGEKSIQSQQFLSTGERIPTTFIKTEPCYIISINSPSKRGYGSVQLGFKQTKRMDTSVKGTLTKAGVTTPLRFLREFRINEKRDSAQFTEENGKQTVTLLDKKFIVGQVIKPSDMFAKGDLVLVSGTSKGKGFQGVVKRHGFKGGPKTHGQSDRQRAPGSIGMTTTPGRVFKGKRMAGRMGSERVTFKGLMVVEVAENGIRVKGLVPGSTGGLLEIRKQD